METLKNQERDDRSDSFRMIGDLITTIAKHDGIDVDERTSARWRDLLGLLREFDTLVDDQGISHKQGLAELQNFSRFKDNYPTLGPPEIDDDTHARMVNRVELILHLGQAIACTRDRDEFVRLRTEEAAETAELLADCASGDTTTQAGFYTRFMPTLRAMATSANFLDTLADYRQDRREQKVQLEPSTTTALLLAQTALANLVRSKHIFTDTQVMKGFYDMSVMRLKNRIEHGKTPYSSLKNISSNNL